MVVLLELDDRVLIERFKAGDKNAFKELVLKYQRKVYMNIYMMISNHQDAKELTQEVFIRVFRHLNDFEGTSTFYTWLYRITVNICIDHYRKAKVKKYEYDDAVAHGDDQEEQVFPIISAASRETPTGRLMKEELRRHVQDAVDRLPPKHREVFLAREVEGLSYQEIADKLEINIGTVMSRLFHARRKLQQRLSRYLDVKPQDMMAAEADQ